MVMLEKGRRTPRSKATQNFLDWLQPDIRSQPSATDAADLSYYNHSVPLHNLEPQQVWAHAALYWAIGRDNNSWIEVGIFLLLLLLLLLPVRVLGYSYVVSGPLFMLVLEIGVCC